MNILCKLFKHKWNVTYHTYKNDVAKIVCRRCGLLAFHKAFPNKIKQYQQYRIDTGWMFQRIWSDDIQKILREKL